jgi:uncharacterized membrane protein YeiH
MIVTAGLVAAFVGGELWTTVLFATAALVPAVAIFFYRNRQRQVSMLIAEFALLVGCAGFGVYGAWFAHTMWSFVPVFLFAALLTNWFALRGVLRDMMLLKNADRLR